MDFDTDNNNRCKFFYFYIYLFFCCSRKQFIDITFWPINLFSHHFEHDEPIFFSYDKEDVTKPPRKKIIKQSRKKNLLEGPQMCLYRKLDMDSSQRYQDTFLHNKKTMQYIHESALGNEKRERKR